MQAQLLMIVHHRNLVSLIGYCDEDESKALVYEYMPNGSLQQHLFGNLYLVFSLLNCNFGPFIFSLHEIPPPFEYIFFWPLNHIFNQKMVI